MKLINISVRLIMGDKMEFSSVDIIRLLVNIRDSININKCTFDINSIYLVCEVASDIGIKIPIEIQKYIMFKKDNLENFECGKSKIIK